MRFLLTLTNRRRVLACRILRSVRQIITLGGRVYRQPNPETHCTALRRRMKSQRIHSAEANLARPSV
jgi:hypothetical protein